MGETTAAGHFSHQQALTVASLNEGAGELATA